MTYLNVLLIFCFSSKGSIILDPDFDIFQEIQHLCQMCKVIGTNKQLVKPGGAQCLPSGNKTDLYTHRVR